QEKEFDQDKGCRAKSAVNKEVGEPGAGFAKPVQRLLRTVTECRNRALILLPVYEKRDKSKQQRDREEDKQRAGNHFVLPGDPERFRSEEHTSNSSHVKISYA